LSLQFFFSLTLFLSSALLFLVQPMIAKMVLPLLGGTPNVWNTCMVFFETALLAGYAYAHAMPAWLGVRRHVPLHLILILAPILVLPLAVGENWTPPQSVDPVFWLLGLLAVCVGLPFFVLSINAPLIQMWFASTGHRSAKDPYFLYAASNLGSMLALLSYPVLVEPHLTLAAQTWLWSIGYGALVLMVFGCAAILLRAPKISGEGGQRTEDRGQKIEDGPQKTQAKKSLGSTTSPPHHLTTPPLAAHHSPLTTHHSPLTTHRLPLTTRLRWVALAFVPSSLMLSVTTYLTTDIAAIPLLWVIPLVLYLLTFILVFARKPPLPHALVVRYSPVVIVALVIVILTQAATPIGPLLVLHLVAFFVIALVCHGELAFHRPPVAHLTEFYLWLAVGGALGGLFNAILAPLLFKGVAEYPLVLVLACVLRPDFATSQAQESQKGKPSRRKRAKETVQSAPVRANVNTRSYRQWILQPRALDFLLPAILGLGTAAMVLIVQSSIPGHNRSSFGFMFLPPAVLCYTFLYRPLRFGLGIGALLLAGNLYIGVYGGETIYRERSFFGVHRITHYQTEEGQEAHELVHGNTVHGRQNMDPKRCRDPLTYYSRTGPIGQVFAAYPGEAARGEISLVGLGAGGIIATGFGWPIVYKEEIALVGLGAGALAAYGEPTIHFTFYEIDPAVIRISRDMGYFTFLRDSRAEITYVEGDARLKLKEATAKYRMIVLDAFSSDSIPLHLLTREAVQLYIQKLAANGLLIFHISSRYVDLQPVLGDLAADAGLNCWAMNDLAPSEQEKNDGKEPSRWVILAPAGADLGRLELAGASADLGKRNENDKKKEKWVEVKRRDSSAVWTDDFSNVFSVVTWYQSGEVN
jgi:hypothetical protein